MRKVQVILEFDEKELGENWMNIDNLKTCLYTKEHTHKSLLKVVDFRDIKTPEKVLYGTVHSVKV